MATLRGSVESPEMAVRRSEWEEVPGSIPGAPIRNYLQTGYPSRSLTCIASRSLWRARSVRDSGLELGASAKLRQIQELLGHKHLDSTWRYTRVTAYELQGRLKRLNLGTPAGVSRPLPASPHAATTAILAPLQASSMSTTERPHDTDTSIGAL